MQSFSTVLPRFPCNLTLDGGLWRQLVERTEYASCPLMSAHVGCKWEMAGASQMVPSTRLVSISRRTVYSTPEQPIFFSPSSHTNNNTTLDSARPDTR